MKDYQTLRAEIENGVLSCNIYLRSVVQSMDIIELLRNCHPYLRMDYAYRLKDLGILTATDAKEFSGTSEIKVTRRIF